MGRYVIYEQAEGGPPEEIDEALDEEDARAIVYERCREYQIQSLLTGGRWMCWWQYEEDEDEDESLDEEE